MADYVMEERGSCSPRLNLPTTFTLGLSRLAVTTHHAGIDIDNDNDNDDDDDYDNSPSASVVTSLKTLPSTPSTPSTPSVTSPAIGYVYYSGDGPLVPYGEALVPYTPSSSSSEDEPQAHFCISFAHCYFVNQLLDFKNDFGIAIDPNDTPIDWQSFITNFLPKLYEEYPEFDPQLLKGLFKSIRTWFWNTQAKKPKRFLTASEAEMYETCKELWG